MQLRRRRGATAVSYGLLVGLIAVAIIAAIDAAGGGVARVFDLAANRIGGPQESAAAPALPPAEEEPPPPVDTGTCPGPSCTYAWVLTGTGPWSHACSSAATRTLTHTCRDSDGETATPGSLCGAQPPGTETGVSDSGCSGIVQNPSFESAEAWIPERPTTADAHSGSRAYIVGEYGNGYGPHQNLNGLQAGSTYRLTFWARTATGTARMMVNHSGPGQGGGTPNYTFYGVTTDWAQFEMEWVETGLSFIRFMAYLNDDPDIYVDDVSVTAVAASP